MQHPIVCRLLPVVLLVIVQAVRAQSLTIVEYNCENMFDCRHDVGKSDEEYLGGAPRYWSWGRYHRKLNAIGRSILATDVRLPGLVVLCEVENDSVVRDLCRRSLLRAAGYDYLVTSSPDVRGIDVAVLWQPSDLRPICYDEVELPVPSGSRPTRNLLHVVFLDASLDTLHLIALHAPSRLGGRRSTRLRRRLAECVEQIVRSAGPSARFIVAGDFNDPPGGAMLRYLADHCHLVSSTRDALGSHGARGTYRYRGKWQRIDHILLSPSLSSRLLSARIADTPFLLERDTRYGGVKPFRTYNGARYQKGVSDHLPLCVVLGISDAEDE